MVMLVPFYLISLHHQKKTSHKQRRNKRKLKMNQTANKDEKKNRTYAVRSMITDTKTSRYITIRVCKGPVYLTS